MYVGSTHLTWSPYTSHGSGHVCIRIRVGRLCPLHFFYSITPCWGYHLVCLDPWRVFILSFSFKSNSEMWVMIHGFIYSYTKSNSKLLTFHIEDLSFVASLSSSDKICLWRPWWKFLESLKMVSLNIRGEFHDPLTLGFWLVSSISRWRLSKGYNSA